MLMTQVQRARTKRASFALAAAIAILLTSCDPVFTPEAHKIGVTRSSTGTVTVLLALCPADILESVSVGEHDANGVPTSTIWKITASTVVVGGAHSFPVGGSPPSGFTTKVPLRSPLPLEQSLYALATLKAGGSGKVFVPANLDSGIIYSSSNTYDSESSFAAAALDGCPKP
jgi:hypothetical protein